MIKTNIKDQSMEESSVKTWTQDEVDNIKSEMTDKYTRLYAEFENFKKRTQKEKEDIRNATKINTLHSILDIDNDISIALNKVKDKSGLDLIVSKLDKFLESQGIVSIQTDTYEPEVHEVVAALDSGNRIVDVVGKGYTLDGNIIKYPRVILGS